MTLVSGDRRRCNHISFYTGGSAVIPPAACRHSRKNPAQAIVEVPEKQPGQNRDSHDTDPFGRKMDFPPVNLDNGSQSESSFAWAAQAKMAGFYGLGRHIAYPKA